jgi:hypothetical protein
LNNLSAAAYGDSINRRQVQTQTGVLSLCTLFRASTQTHRHQAS